MISVLIPCYNEKNTISEIVDRAQLDEAMKQLTGKVYNVPPEISAVRVQVRTRKIAKFEILDFIKLGAIQFILIFGASSAARDTVKPSIAALADEIIL